MMSDVRVFVASSTAEATNDAVAEVATALRDGLGGTPDWCVISHSAAYDLDVLRSAVAAGGFGPMVHGSSSCLGAMSHDGFHSVDGVGIAAWGIRDPEGDYGTALAGGDDPGVAASDAIRAAVAAANRPGEVPALVWVSAAPGAEEGVLNGIAQVLGPEVPVVGGSSADNEIAGQWSQLTTDGNRADGILVSALFPSCEVGLAFHSGYAPTECSAIATHVEGRDLCAWMGVQRWRSTRNGPAAGWTPKSQKARLCLQPPR